MKVSGFILIIIFLVFIALGLPDALLGASWNQSRLEFGVEIGAIGYYTFMSYISILVATFYAPHILTLFKTKAIVATSVLGMGISLIVISRIPTFGWLLLMAIPMGLGSGLIDLSLQHYVAYHLKAAHMNFLHSFYGVGVTLGPFLMATALAFSSWRQGYVWVGFILVVISLFIIGSFSFWPPETKAQMNGQKSARIKEAFKTPGVKNSILIFLVAVHVESMIGVFIATYAYVALGFSFSVAALATTTFFLAMTLSRILSGMLTLKVKAQTMVIGGEILLGLAAVVLAISLWVPTLAFVSFFLLGLGSGPIYPNMMHLNKEFFGSFKLSRVMSLQMVIGYTGFGILTPLAGQWFERVSVLAFPYFVFLMGTLLLTLSVIYFKRQKRALKS
jgi:MFS family permease